MQQMSYEDNFRGRISELYQESRLSIKGFADFCEVSRQSMQYYLSGERMPDSAGLLKICKACSVSADWLLALTNVRTLSTDMQSTVQFSGLQESALDTIKNKFDQDERDALSELVVHYLFPYALDHYAAFQRILNHVDDFDQASNWSDFCYLENGRVSLDAFTASNLMISQFSRTFTEICKDKQNKKMYALAKKLPDNDPIKDRALEEYELDSMPDEEFIEKRRTDISEKGQE